MNRRIRAMKDRDIIPFDIQHYTATTGHLSTMAHGANILLSIDYMAHGALPEPAKQKMQICKIYNHHEWLEIAWELTAPVDHPFAFVFRPDWSHPYLDRVREVKRLGPSFNPSRLHSLSVRRPIVDDWQAIRARIFARDDYTCTYCGTRGGALECDHMVPISRGGPSTDDNLTTACKPCNREKRARTVVEWRGVA